MPIYPRTNEATPHEKDGVVWYTFPALDVFADRMKHGFSTRLGGVSSGGGRDSLNLGTARGDDPANVIENYRRFGAAAGFDPEDTVFARQDHHTVLRQVTAADRGKGLFRQREYGSTDGLYTTEPGVTLITHYADCTSLFFYAPDKNLIASSHAGWRGVAKKMGLVTAVRLADLGCNIKETVAVIGPSAGPGRYEVDEDCAACFADFRDEQGPMVRPEPGVKGKYLVDLWRADRCALLEGGLLPENIHIAGICTISHPEIFYSHRVQGNARGTMAGFMKLLP